MRKIVTEIFDFLKRKLFFGDEDVGDVEIRQQKTFDKSIEIEFGNLSQLNGFKPYEDRISNRIGISELDAIGIVPRMLFKYLQRMGTWLVFIHALVAIIVYSTYTFWSAQFFTFSAGDMILLYLVPVIFSFVMFSLRELNIERERNLQENVINKQHCTIFKFFKKVKLQNLQNINNSLQQDQIEDQEQRLPNISKQIDEKPIKGFSNFKKEKEKESSQINHAQDADNNSNQVNNQISSNVQTNNVNSTPNNQNNSGQNNIQLSPNLGSVSQNQKIEKHKTYEKEGSSQINSNIQIANNKGVKESVTINSHYQKLNTRVMNTNYPIKTVKILEEIKWEQLEVGNIVWLKNGEIAPADLLILDCRQSFCTVEEDIQNGKTYQIEKYPPQLTSVSVHSKLKQNMFEYRKLLSGRIEYTKQSRRKEFSGFLKMNKDPKGENLDCRNIIYRGSKLVFSEWVYGIVLYAGKDTKIYQQSYNKETMKTSFFGKKAKLFFLVAYIHLLVSIAISIFFVIFQPCYVGFSYTWLEKQDFLGLILSFMVEYLHIMPQLFYSVVDVIEMVNDLYHNKYFKKVDIQTQNNQSGNNYQMLRSVTLGDISLTNFVFLDKTGTLTDGEIQQVRLIIVDGVMYSLNLKMAEQIMKNKSFTFNNHSKSVKELIDGENMVIADEKQSMNNDQSNQSNVINMFPNLLYQTSIPTKKNNQSKQIQHKNSFDASDELDEEECRDEVKNSMDSKKMKMLQVPNQPDSPSLNNSFQKDNSIQQETNSLDKTKPIKQSEVIQNSRQGSHKLSTGHSDNILDENDFITSLHNDYDKKHHEAILITVICNHIISSYDSKSDEIINTNVSKEGEIMKQFSNVFNYQFKCSSVYKGQSYSPNYIVVIQGKLVSFKILAINENTQNRPYFSILFRDPNSLYPNRGAVLYTKISLKNTEVPQGIVFKDKEQRVRLEKQLQFLVQNGMRPIIYCKRELNDEKTDDYLRQYENLKKNLVQDDSKLESLYDDIEKDLQIVTVFGVAENLKKGADIAIKQMRLAGLHTWMLTGDSYIQAITAAYQSHLIDQEIQILHLEGKNYDQIKLLIRDQLNAIQNESKLNKLIPQNPTAYKRYLEYIFTDHTTPVNSPGLNKNEVSSRKMSDQQASQNTNIYNTSLINKKQFISAYSSNPFYNQSVNRKKSMSIGLNQKPYLFCIVVSSEALTTIFSDNYLRNHFYFLSYFCTSLIGYDLQTNQKGWFVRMVKQKYPQNPKTLAIGDSYNDADMMQSADISIQMKNFKYNVNYIGDIMVNDFTSISNLLYSNSRYMAELYEELLLYAFYRAFLLGYIILFIEASNCSYGNSLWNSLEIFFFHSLLYVVSITSYLIKKYSKKHKYSINNEILIDQFKNSTFTFKKQKTMGFFYKVVFHSLAEAFVLYLNIYFVFNFDSNDVGKSYTLKTVEMYGYFLIGIATTMKILVVSNQNFKEGITTFLFFCICYFIYLPLEDLYQNYPFQFQEVIEQISSSVHIIIFMISIIFFVFGFQIILEYCLFIPSFFPQSLVRQASKYYKLLQFKENEDEKSDEKYQKKKKKAKKNENIINRLIGIIFPQEDQEDMDIILKNMISSEDMSEQNQEMNKFSLQFKNPDLEKKFTQSVQKSWILYNKYYQLIILILFELMQLLIYSVKSKSEPQLDYIIGQTIGCIIISGITFTMFTSKGEKQFFKLNYFCLFLRILTKIFTDILQGSDNSLESFTFSYFINFTVLCRPDYVMYGSILEAFVFFVKYSIQSSFNSNIDRYISLSIILFTLGYCLFCIQTKYQYETVERQDYLSQNKLRIESAKINNILAILLPKFVRDRISNTGEIQLAENQGEVAVLFCDICDFDNILQSESEKIVALLDNLFRNFDILCSQNDCTKIETVGKTYVAASGLSLELQNKKKHTVYNSVERLINLGFDMQDYVKNISWGKHGDKMRVKIGIHYGRVMAGVIGYHKPQFSLIGDTINTTSRVMSTGEDNRMTISSQAYAKIQTHNLSNYRTNRKEVEAKGKGVMVTYQIFKQNQKYIKGTSKKTEVFKPGSKQTAKGSMYQKQSPMKRTMLDTKNMIQPGSKEERKMSYLNAKQSPQNNQSNNSPRFTLTSPMNSTQQIKLAMGGIKSVNLTRKVAKKNTVKLGYQPAPHQFAQPIALDSSQGADKKTTLMSPLKLKSYQLQSQQSQDKDQQAKNQPINQQLTSSKHSIQMPNTNNGAKRNESNLTQNTINKIEQAIKEEVHLEQANNLFIEEIDAEFINELFENNEEEKGDKENGQYLQLTKKSLFLALDNSKPDTQQFYDELFEQSKKSIRLKYLGYTKLLLIKCILVFLASSVLSNYYVASIIWRSLFCFMLYLNHWTKNKFFYSSLLKFRIVIFFIMIMGVTIVTVETYQIGLQGISTTSFQSFLRVQTAEVFIIYIIFSSLQCMEFYINVILYLILLIVWIFCAQNFGAVPELIYFMIIIGLVHLSYQYLLFKLYIKTFNNHKNLSKKTKEQNQILSNLLPKHVLEKFLNNPETTRLELVDNFEDVTILFADIAGFTKYSSQVDPEQVVNMLKKLFYEFDKACQENEIFKLYTIGDCYVVIGFTDIRKRNPAEEAKNVLNMGFNMIEIIKQLRAQVKFESLDMRIGVHTGKIIGGVIGTDIVRYDIYGRDVVIANKMESSGEQGRILVSSQTRKLLEPSGIFDFVDDKEVKIKSIDTVVNASFVNYKKIDESQIKDIHGTISQFDEEHDNYNENYENDQSKISNNLQSDAHKNMGSQIEKSGDNVNSQKFQNIEDNPEYIKGDQGFQDLQHADSNQDNEYINKVVAVEEDFSNNNFLQFTKINNNENIFLQRYEHEDDKLKLQEVDHENDIERQYNSPELSAQNNNQEKNNSDSNQNESEDQVENEDFFI
ncbi:adenylate/guanylate cyclase domain protein (macronuclear) [Tetrahymena thermophila SB210]|uniref:adenylate cyclase n=1 Tax=Tetrahymena thermophila (strain SB210) TaxID=312017 RepID=Q238W6_TETTS|nr:adenylate/guanylate cyclase domain protein [Tetrahymena thermophila SB210]EAR93104.2 adenylate/guanylate cyclase domain protein [Tetrahymena thermophila SB210]|eukprot:XP_001013349.2 adenylate/guanylate cyclase domain protein [Tetrahymena thermophila SB210]